MKKEEKVKGLGGWLILPIIGLFISIPILLYDIFSTIILYEINSYVGFLLFLDMALLTVVIIALVGIFNKKKYVPQLMVAFYIANIVIMFILSILIGDFTNLIRPVVGGAIWIPYFLVSERVKNTFVK